MKYLAPLALASLASAATLPPSRRATGAKFPSIALYTQTNSGEGNQIQSLPLDNNGLITSNGTFTSTGGLGARAPAIKATDALNSQGQMTIAGDYLYAVNAGSDTLSVFHLDRNDPLHPTLVGKPYHTIGNFPMSVTVYKQTACVATSGKKSGVTCFTIGSNGALSKPIFQPLALNPQQAVLPTGPYNTISQVFFSSDGAQLWVTQKGGPVGNAPGFFATFYMDKGFANATPVISRPAGTLMLFGSLQASKDTIFFTDPSYGAGVLRVNADGTATLISNTTIPNQQITCWCTYNDVTDLFYTGDDGANVVAAFTPAGKLVHVTSLKNGNPQMLEMASSGDKVYGLSQGNMTTPAHIAVMQTHPGGVLTTAQNFEVPAGFDAEGLILLSR